MAPDAGPYTSLATDAGFASDAGERGLVIDTTSPDAGPREVELTRRVSVHIEGATVMPPEVYLDILKLPERARPDEATAKVLQGQLLEFLVRTGFELATVTARVTDAGIDLEINEGQIERMIFIGQLSFQQLRFKLALSLPNDVFNRPLLDRQVRELAESMGLVGVRWDLVRTGQVAHQGPQVEQLPVELALATQGQSMIHARRPYEVHIVFPQNTTGTGLGIDLRAGYLDGMEAGVNYLGRDLFFEGDRWFTAGSGGFGLRARIDTDRLYAHFSRAFFTLRYDLFPLLGHLRPNFWVESTWLARQRIDLNLENYNALNVDTAVQLELEVRQGFHFLAGAGFEWRRIFGFEASPSVTLPPDVRLDERKRLFIRVTHESVVDPAVLRWDRRHTLESEFREYLPIAGEPNFGWVELRYQYVRGFGWHDFWVKSRAHASWGEVNFHDELSVAELVRGAFGAQFTPSAINLTLEYRFSITRDVLKVSVFNDLALFALPPRNGGNLTAELADGFGPGVHLLVQDMFQVDMYFTFGFRRLAVFGVAFTMQIQKAF